MVLIYESAKIILKIKNEIRADIIAKMVTDKVKK